MAIPDCHGHVKGEHRPYAEERPIPYTARMLFLWFYHACVRQAPRFLMASDHMNLLTFEDPSAVNLVRRALKLAQAGDLYGAAETANVELVHAAAVSEGLRKRNMRYSIGAEVDNDPRCRPDAANIVEAMRPDGMIRAVHFIPIDHPTHGAGWQWAFDYPEFSSLFDHVGTEAVWKIYAETMWNTIETMPGQIIAHFYKPAIFGHWPEQSLLEGYEDRLIEMCAERSLAIELNSRIFYKSDDADQVRRFRDAHLRLLKKAKAADVLIAVGADAHSPRDQGGGFETVLEMLDAADINELAFPIAGRLARVALRVPKEPEKPAPPPPPEPAPAPAKAAPSEAAVAAKKRRAAAKAAKPSEPPAQSAPAMPEAPAAPAPKAPRVRPARVRTTPPPKRVTAPPAVRTPAAKPAVKAKATLVKSPLEKRAAPKKLKPVAAPAKKTAPARAAAKPLAKAKAAVKKTAAKVRLKATPKTKPAAKKAAAAKAPAAKAAARTKPAARSTAKKPAAKKAPAKKAAPATKVRTAKSSGAPRGKAPALKKRAKPRR